MNGRTYASLDDLAADFKPGTRIRYQAGGSTRLAMVVGYVYSLPFEPGGRDEPALVTSDDRGIGNVYPHEVVKRSPASSEKQA